MTGEWLGSKISQVDKCDSWLFAKAQRPSHIFPERGIKYEVTSSKIASISMRFEKS